MKRKNDEKSKRPWTRMPSKESATLTNAAGKSWPGHIIDESFNGFALTMDFAPELKMGERVNVMYYGAPAAAEVRRVDEHLEGGYVVGLVWLDEAAPA